MKNILTILLIASSLISCAPSGQYREDYTKAHPELDTDTKVDIIMGRIRRGMTQEQVKVVMGEPCGYCYGTRKSSWGDVWEYNPFGTGRNAVGAGTYLFFDKHGRLSGWTK